jgi:uncharacterized protein YhaN
MNMPAIAEQVATIEHDLQEALAKVDSLTAEKEALRKALAAVSVEKSDLEAKQNDMQSLVDDTREMVDRLANMSLTMLRTSRRIVAGPELNASNSASGDKDAASEMTGHAEAAAQPKSDLTGQNIGLRRISASEPEKTASERLRAGLLLDTASGALDVRAPRTKLPEGMPMFLQEPKIERRHSEHRPREFA